MNLLGGHASFTEILQDIFQDSKQIEGNKNTDMAYRHAKLFFVAIYTQQTSNSGSKPHAVR